MREAATDHNVIGAEGSFFRISRLHPQLRLESLTFSFDPSS
jgi:hypothetical protein